MGLPSMNAGNDGAAGSGAGTFDDVAGLVLPGANRLLERMYATMSLFMCADKDPGRPTGIVVRIRWERSSTDRSLQLARNFSPASAGVSSPPPSSAPWQPAHCSAYAVLPRAASCCV